MGPPALLQGADDPSAGCSQRRARLRADAGLGGPRRGRRAPRRRGSALGPGRRPDGCAPARASSRRACSAGTVATSMSPMTRRRTTSGPNSGFRGAGPTPVRRRPESPWRLWRAPIRRDPPALGRRARERPVTSAVADREHFMRTRFMGPRPRRTRRRLSSFVCIEAESPPLSFSWEGAGDGGPPGWRSRCRLSRTTSSASTRTAPGRSSRRSTPPSTRSGRGMRSATRASEGQASPPDACPPRWWARLIGRRIN